MNLQRLPRIIWALFTASAVVGCGGGGQAAGNGNASSCSVAEQRQAVHDFMIEWYFFNDEPEQQR